MVFGLLADIHEELPLLEAALAHFRRRAVERVIVLGDLVKTGCELEATVRLLEQAGAVGVWGNHELGLCHQPDPELLANYPAGVADYMSRLRPRWEWERFVVTHAAPTIDPTDPVAYYNSPRPCDENAREACFRQEGDRVMLMGHYHQWFAATPAGELAWRGERPLELASSRSWLIVIHAVMDGWCGVLDTEREMLVPHLLEPT